MIALLYFGSAAVLLFLADRFVGSFSRRAAAALVLMPLLFTGRAVFTGGVYAPVELPYGVLPLSDHREELHVGPPQNGMLTDIAFIMIPWREAVRRAVAEGEWPLWNRFELCGDPLAAGMQVAVYSPFTWVALLLPSAVSFTYTGAIAFFLAALGTSLLARELGRSEIASLIAAAIFVLSAPIALQILWPLGFAWALFPMLLLAVRRAVLAPGARSIAVLTTAFALVIVAGHPETLFHTVVIAGLYGLFLLRHWRSAAALAAAGILALLLTAVALLPFFEAARHSGEYAVRAQMFAKAPLKVAPGSVKAALVSDLFPFLRVRFPSFLLPRAEAGSIALALALIALGRVRSRETWFFSALGVVALLAGANAWPVAPILHRLPLFDVTINDRLVSVVPLCLAVLAAFAVDAGGWWWAPIGLSVLIAAAAVGFGVPLDGMRLVADLAPLAILPLIRRRELLLGLILAQRVFADGALIPTHRPPVAYPPLALFEPLRGVREPFRITAPGATLIPNIATMYGLEDVRGATPMTFAPLAELFPFTEPMESMMNVRYAVTGTWEPIPPGWHEVIVDRQSRLIENERVLPRAFVPPRVRGAANEVAEMRTLSDFAEVAWIDGGLSGHRPAEGGRHTVTTEREGSGLRIHAAMDASAYVVISQTAWPGWRGYLDGRRVPLLRANHAFLAVHVPAGRHEIRLRYLPQSFVVGRTISVAVLLLLSLGCLIRQVM